MEFYNKWSVIFIGRLMKDFDLDLLSAVAIVGNAGHESGGFKQLQEVKPLVKGSKGGWGIMQWTGPRRREAESYWDRNSMNPSSMDANYAFLFVELKGPEGRVLNFLRNAKTLDDKVEIFSKTFLRPGIPHLESRKTWARRAHTAYVNDNPTTLPQVRPQSPIQKPENPKVDSGGPWWLSLFLGFLRAIIRGGK